MTTYGEIAVREGYLTRDKPDGPSRPTVAGREIVERWFEYDVPSYFDMNDDAEVVTVIFHAVFHMVQKRAITV